MIEIEQIKQRLNELLPEIDNLHNAFNIKVIKSEVESLEQQTNDQNFWSDVGNSTKVLKEIKGRKATIDTYNSMCENFEDLQTLIEIALEENDESLLDEIKTSFESLSNEVENQKLATLLNGEFDANNAIISFHSGAGGTEAQDWVMMLYRMYTRFAQRHNFSTKIIDYLDGEEAGIKSATILIEGHNAYGFLKSEAGVHRLVRISPFDSGGRRHTSFASLEVTPLIEDDLNIEIKDEDLKVDTYRASGAGGQHVNKTESAIRITHLPTGVVVSCQQERSQHQNRDYCMKLLKSKLIEIKEREHLDKIEDIKGEQKDIAFGAQIRSYVFMPYTLVKDHRTNFENGNIGAVMDGDIDEFINAHLIYQKNI